MVTRVQSAARFTLHFALALSSAGALATLVILSGVRAGRLTGMDAGGHTLEDSPPVQLLQAASAQPGSGPWVLALCLLGFPLVWMGRALWQDHGARQVPVERPARRGSLHGGVAALAFLTLLSGLLGGVLTVFVTLFPWVLPAVSPWTPGLLSLGLMFTSALLLGEGGLPAPLSQPGPS